MLIVIKICWNRTILALLAFLFGSLTVCGHWNSEEVCNLRFHYMAFLIAVGILGLTGYAYHLRRRLEKGGVDFAKGLTGVF